MNGATGEHCGARLVHVHGVTECERNPLHTDDLGPMVDHLGDCEVCRENGDAPDLSWTGYRESWIAPSGARYRVDHDGGADGGLT